MTEECTGSTATERRCPACGLTLQVYETHWSVFPNPAGAYVCPAAPPSVTEPETPAAPTDPADDPILGEDGYPSEAELQRIREWPWEGGFRSLMDYVRRRWQYAEHGYWTQRGDHFEISTGGWSGNESIIGALEANQMFSMLCPLSWRRGGHYVYDVQEWDDNPEPGKRVLVRDPATPAEAAAPPQEREGIDANTLRDLDTLTRRIYATAQYHVERGRNGPDIPRSMHRSRGEDEMKWADELRLISARLSGASEPGASE